MVAFALENIPSSIKSIEALVVWGQSILANVHATSANTERQGEPPTLNATLAPFDIRAADPSWNYSVSYRVIGRLSYPLAEDYQAKKLWEAVQPLEPSEAVIPPQFL